MPHPPQDADTSQAADTSAVLEEATIQQVFDTGFWTESVLSISMEDWLVLAGVWLALSVVFIAAVRFLRGRMQRLADRTDTSIDDSVAALLGDTRAFFLVVLALFTALFVLRFPESIREVVGTVTILALLWQIIQWGQSLIRLYVRRHIEPREEAGDMADVTAIKAIGFLARMVLWIVVSLVALQTFGVQVTALVAGLGVGGIAIALAVQSVLKDFFAYVSILLDKPFTDGDFLVIGDFVGSVQHIGLKTTRIRSLSGEQIVFSNDDLLNSRIRNYKRMEERRVVFTFGVVYQTPAEQLEAIPGLVRDIIEAQAEAPAGETAPDATEPMSMPAEPTMDKPVDTPPSNGADEPPEASGAAEIDAPQERVRFDRAHFKSYGDFSLNFEVVYFIHSPDYLLYMDIQQAVNLALFRTFEERGIEFAYPTRTLYVNQSGPTNGSAGGGPQVASSLVPAQDADSPNASSA